MCGPQPGGRACVAWAVAGSKNGTALVVVQARRCRHEQPTVARITRVHVIGMSPVCITATSRKLPVRQARARGAAARGVRSVAGAFKDGSGGGSGGGEAATWR